MRILDVSKKQWFVIATSVLTLLLVLVAIASSRPNSSMPEGSDMSHTVSGEPNSAQGSEMTREDGLPSATSAAQGKGTTLSATKETRTALVETDWPDEWKDIVESDDESGATRPSSDIGISTRKSNLVSETTVSQTNRDEWLPGHW